MQLVLLWSGPLLLCFAHLTFLYWLLIFELLLGNAGDNDLSWPTHGGWHILWWKRTACFADEVAFREIRKASGCQPSATWCLGLLLVLFRLRCLSLCVPAPTSYLCLSVSLTLHCSLYFFREPHADSLGHCVNGGHFVSQAPANRENWAAVLHSLPKHTSISTCFQNIRFVIPIWRSNMKFAIQLCMIAFVLCRKLKGWNGNVISWQNCSFLSWDLSWDVSEQREEMLISLFSKKPHVKFHQTTEALKGTCVVNC